MTDAEKAALAETQADIEKARAELVKMAAENMRRARAAVERSEAAMTRALVEDIYAQAMEQTGLSRDEINRLAEQYAREEAARPALQPTRPSRAMVAARGVPERHLRSVYDREPVECDSLAFVRAFAGSERHFLVLSGGPGVRKSGSSAWALIEHGGLFLPADEVVAIAGARSEDQAERWRDAKRLDLLVVDDLGTEYHDRAGWFRTVFERLLFARYDACVKTIITTRLDAVDFRAAVGIPVSDRITEAGEFAEIGGASVRGGAR